MWLAAHDEQDTVSQRIQKIQEMEAVGAEVMVFGVDVSNYAQMQTVISEAKQRFGKINGILHTAALADYAGIIQERSREETAGILAPKVMGTLVLNHLLQDDDLDFFLLFSSIGNLDYKKKFGQVGYNAANEFLDAFAHYKNSHDGTFTVAVNWDDWQEVGMAVEAYKKKVEREKKNIDYQTLLKDGLTPAEGVEVFLRVLDVPVPQVAVSTVDLQRRVDTPTEVVSLRQEDDAHEEERVSGLYPRPCLQNEYVAPESATEEIIAEIWQDLFGIEQVGVHDNFFELGGSSLLATQVISRIRKAFQIDLPFKQFFDVSTVADLSATVEEILINEIEALPEDEAQRIVEAINNSEGVS